MTTADTRGVIAAPAALTAPSRPSARPRNSIRSNALSNIGVAKNMKKIPEALTPQQAAQKLRELPKRDRARLDAFLVCGCRANRAAELLECDPEVVSGTFRRYQNLLQNVMAGILNGDEDLDLDFI